MNPDILMFFDQKPLELDLYLAFEAAVLGRFPDTQISIQKTQISLRSKYIFACVSLRRKKNWPDRCILVSLGMPEKIDSPRIAESSRISAGRWTLHIPIAAQNDIDSELMNWLEIAHSLASRPGRRLS